MENNSLEKVGLSPEEKLLEKFKVENEKLLAKNKELEEKVESRDQFIEIIAHDLKSPMSGINNLVNLLLEKVDTMPKEQMIFLLSAISQQGESTYRLLEDLLEWVKFQKDGIKPEISNLKLLNQIEDAIAPLLQIAKNKEIKLDNQVSNKDIEVQAGSMMLKTVIRNLTSNSIKFTKKGGNILISSKIKGDTLEITVSDDGVGLNEKTKESLFKGIVSSSTGTNNEKGTGLGLSLCYEMVTKMGGTIRAESEGQGKGSQFIITLPKGK
jgi:two-component system, sensor histidine kinase and response regulator